MISFWELFIALFIAHVIWDTAAYVIRKIRRRREGT